jgi:two-component system cell cycle sensor histidine kinase/response regulator CckA
MFERVPISYQSLDAQGRLLEVNQRWLDTLGYAHADVIGRPFAEFLTPASAETFRRAFPLFVEAGSDWEAAYELVRQNGSIIPARFEGSMDPEADGSLRRTHCVFVDETERLGAETALRESEDLLRALLESADDIVATMGLDGRYLYYNGPARYGLTAADVVGRLPSDFHRAEDAVKMMDRLRMVVETGEPLESEDIIHWDGEPLWFTNHLYPIRDAQGLVKAVGTVSRNVTERRMAEQALRDAVIKLRAVISASPVAVIALDPDENVKMWNPAAERMFGWTQDEIIDQPYPLCPPQLQEESARLSERWHNGECVVRLETQRQSKDGRLIDVSMSTAPLYDSAGNVIGDMGLMEDITERKQAERALRESEQRYRSLAEDISDWIWEMDAQGRFTYCNPRATEITGYPLEELMGRTPAFLKGEAELEERHFRAIAAGASMRQGEVTFDHRDGHPLVLEVSGVPVMGPSGTVVGFRGVARDVTERREAEAERRLLESQVQQAQKLESLGILAGGIAHDFNNLLVGILGNADLALMDLSESAAARESVQEIRTAAERAAELTKQMLAYSGKGRFVVESVDLNSVVRELAHLLESSISKKAELVFDFASDLPGIEADVTQIRQVIMNLLTNASEALGANTGIISISTRALDCNRAFLDHAALDTRLPEGRYVCLEVSDTGCGMDQETQQRIFDPFFSTKFAGRGLGLAATQGIVRGHHGAVRVYSTPGKGTRFSLLFPAHHERPHATAPHEPVTWSGQGRVLLVDDEETVRLLGRRMLERAGFEVLLAADGYEALERFRSDPEGVCCVVLDLTMPRMGGQETFRALRRLRPDVRVIISSGYDQYEVMREFEGEPLVGFLQKPYEYAGLTDELRTMLEW